MYYRNLRMQKVEKRRNEKCEWKIRMKMTFLETNDAVLTANFFASEMKLYRTFKGDIALHLRAAR